MNESVRRHLTAIVGITLLGAVTGCLALSFVHDAAAGMSAGAFSTWIIVVPCAVMLVASFAITATASEIGRQLFLTVLAICLVAGVASMLVTSSWMSDPALSAQLLANSEEGTVLTPVLRSPIIVLRDIAAFVVVPTIGCIAGAWVGSRLHPVAAAPDAGTGKRKGGKRKR